MPYPLPCPRDNHIRNNLPVTMRVIALETEQTDRAGSCQFDRLRQFGLRPIAGHVIVEDGPHALGMPRTHGVASRLRCAQGLQM